MGPATRRLSAAINRTDAVNGVPFAAPVEMTPRVHERLASWVHYGVMVPGLNAPHRRFGVMAILGTAGVPCFDNDWALATAPRDAVTVVSGTATDGGLELLSMARDCELAADGSRLALGDNLVLEGRPPHVRVRRAGAVPVDLRLEVTRTVSYFSRLPGLYDHWSLLARVTGTVGGDPVATLGTYEYARGFGPYTVARRVVPDRLKLPLRAFTYQVLTLDDEQQLLLTVAGPRFGRHLHEGAWERGLQDHGAMHRDVELTVDEQRARPLITPDGCAMPMPARWRWRVRDDAGQALAELRFTADDDWTYGLGAGYVGSARFEGTVRGRAVAGGAYVEWVQR